MARFERTGKFDPWYALRERAEAEVLMERQRRQSERPVLKLTAKSTDEERAAFIAAAKGDQQDLEEAVDEWLLANTEGWDRYCCDKLTDLYDEAFWLDRTQQFADGRPRREQNDWRVWLLGMIVVGIENRRNGVKPDKEPDGSGGEVGDKGYREMTPEELDQWHAKHK